jgi:hypothetical protein
LSSRFTRTRKIALTCAAVLAAAILTPVGAAQAATNLVTNPGFETGDLTGWSCSGGSVVSSPAHGGAHALAGAASASDDAQCTQTVPVVSGSQYTLSAYVEGNYVYLGVTGGASTWTPGASGWTQLTTTFTATSGSAQIYLHGWYAQGTYYADDVSLTGPGGVVTVPSAPTGLHSTGTTSSSVSLAWTGSSGATGYNVYQGSTKVASTSGTSATVSGLAANTTYTFTVTATNSAGESAHSSGVNVTTQSSGGGGSGSPRSWPYIDITMSTPTLAQVAQATGQKFFTLAFVLGSSSGCVPSWGGTIALNDSRIAGEISALRALGGDVAVSFGGAAGPYLASVCSSAAAQAAAYEQVIDMYNIKHIDFDIEAAVDIDMMNKAIAQVQQQRPGTTVSYTLEVVGDTYGIVDSIGTQVLSNAVANGVTVSIVNPMTMDYGASAGMEWGDSVIAAAQATEHQMAAIWPSKSSAELYRMLGVTPMIGRNDTGPIFSIADGQKLVAWANSTHIGQLAFWSVGRDNGGCPGGGVSPTCSSISQSTYQFTGIFAGFTG